MNNNNLKKRSANKGHNSYPWEFQQTVGRPALQQLHKYVYEEFQHLFSFNFGVHVQ
jgi:hypothetical protein